MIYYSSNQHRPMEWHRLTVITFEPSVSHDFQPLAQSLTSIQKCRPQIYTSHTISSAAV